MVSSPSIFDRSISCAGRARRCFITGTSVWPPAITLASSLLASRFAACRTVAGRENLKSYINRILRKSSFETLSAAREARSGRLRHRLCAGGDRLDDVVVAGAAAEVALELLADGVVVEIVTLAVDHIDRGHDHAGRAEAALQTVIG